jgi:hypothetical protein
MTETALPAHETLGGGEAAAICIEAALLTAYGGRRLCRLTRLLGGRRQPPGHAALGGGEAALMFPGLGTAPDS